MSEHALSSATFAPAISGAESQAKRVSVGVAALTMILASALLWGCIYVAIRFIFGL